MVALGCVLFWHDHLSRLGTFPLGMSKVFTRSLGGFFCCDKRGIQRQSKRHDDFVKLMRFEGFLVYLDELTGCENRMEWNLSVLLRLFYYFWRLLGLRVPWVNLP